ncbi:MAG: helix-turn-helix transcriptional regulator [Alphaproteobacteria bacterium]
MTEALPGADPFGRLSRKDAAELLGVKPGTLANWATTGTGPRPYRMRGKVFYLASDLREFALEGVNAK